MLKLKQAIVVEGRYDKSKLASLVDAQIITTDGFDIFRDKQKLALIRRLAEREKLILLTDPDAAGFRIRAHIAGAVGEDRVIHVYIPDIFGKERRKPRASAEGKLGVEGVSAETIREAFARAGVPLEGEAPPARENPRPITQADLMERGIAGGENSSALRQRLLKKLRLPARMNTKALLRTLNALYTYEEFVKLLEMI